jgi:hypothetical protein
MFSGMAFHARAASDSLYWECDTVPRSQSARMVNLVPDDAGCESAHPCGPVLAGKRVLADGGTETFHYRMRNVDTVKDGGFEIRNRSGRLRQRGGYVSGRRSGEWITWYPDGKMRSVEHYRDGKREGLHREYSTRGRITDEFKYRDGKLDCADGYHRSWYHNGKLKFELAVENRKLARYVFYDSLGKELGLPVILDP